MKFVFDDVELEGKGVFTVQPGNLKNSNHTVGVSVRLKVKVNESESES